MNLMESFRIALRAINANKVRAGLTMLGVIIGVAAVILLVSIGQGVQNSITGQLEGLGSNLMFVIPAKIDTAGGGGGGGGGGGITKPWKQQDVTYLQARLPSDVLIVPIIQTPATVKRGNKVMSTTIAAATDQGTQVFNQTLAEGRHYNKAEYTAGARVVALGSTVRDQLFPNVANPVGMTITLEGQPFIVIGTYQSQGGGFGGSTDNRVYIPLTTAMNLIGTQNISTIVAKAPTGGSVDAVKADIERTLSRLRPGGEYTVFTQAQTLGILSTLLGTLTGVLAGIAAISLLVGGIGIMNIMLVSVSERTREIGIRKAVGARTFDILAQFVIEAVLLSVLGGIIGIVLGVGIALLLNSFTPVPAGITWWSIVLAFSFSAVVGVFFGVYPAFTASRLDPIVALRYE
jgi:putative ABC transport system permease protein